MVARAGTGACPYEELRLDYEDYLRQRGLTQWEREDPRRVDLIGRRCANAEGVAEWVKDVHDGKTGLCGRSGQGGQSGRCGRGEADAASMGSTKSTSSMLSTESTYAEISANGALALIAVACALLDRQLASQAKAFEDEGGFAERLYRVRRQSRGKA